MTNSVQRWTKASIHCRWPAAVLSPMKPLVGTSTLASAVL
jgi:hypothetical protein